MELRHFQYFVTVAEELHFGRAARRLGISQPPLSQQIKALEGELGLALFNRTNRRVALTPAGTIFLEEARKVLSQFDHAVETVRRAHRGEVGEVLIGLTASVPFFNPIANRIAAFRRDRPGVRLTMREMSNTMQMAALVERRIEVGFMRGGQLPDLPADLKSILLSEEPLVAAMRDDHPLARAPGALTMRDLEKERFILYVRALGFGFHEQVVALCHNAGFEPNVAQEVLELSTLIGFVATGLGITVLPASLQALQAEHMVYRAISDTGGVTRLWMLHRKAGLSAAAAAFTESIAAVRDR